MMMVMLLPQLLRCVTTATTTIRLGEKRKKKNCAFSFDKERECYIVDLFADTTLRLDGFFAMHVVAVALRREELPIRPRTRTRKKPTCKYAFHLHYDTQATMQRSHCCLSFHFSRLLFILSPSLGCFLQSSRARQKKKKALFRACIYSYYYPAIITGLFRIMPFLIFRCRC